MLGGQTVSPAMSPLLLLMNLIIISWN